MKTLSEDLTAIRIVSTQWMLDLQRTRPYDPVFELPIFASPSYVRHLEAVLEHSAEWIIASDKSGQVAALLPLMIANLGGYRVVNALPFFGGHGGPFLLSDDLTHLERVAVAFADRCLALGNVVSSTLVGLYDQDPAVTHRLLQILGPPSDVRISQVTQLGDVTCEADLLRIFSDPRPRNIKKARTLGVSIHESRAEEDLLFLYQTHRANIEHKGGIPKPWAFFESLKHHLLEEQWSLYVATLGGRRVAALLMLHQGKTAEYFVPAIEHESRSTQALSLVIFEAMKSLASAGVSEWNWGGTWTSQEGVYEFKKRWGAKESTYPYWTHVYNAQVRRKTLADWRQEAPYFYIYPEAKVSEP